MKDDKPIFTPLDFIKHISETRKVSVKSLKVPRRMIIVYRSATFSHIQQSYSGKIFEWIYGDDRPFYILDHAGVRIGVFRSSVGAPAAAFLLEELITCGAKEIIEVGIAGGIQSNLNVGDIIVVTEAVRDEGTSNNYFPPEVRLESSEKLRGKIVGILEREKIRFRLGTVWTTDALYRETKGKFLKYKSQGVLAIDMETSALFAVAKHRKANIASLQVVSDILSETGWSPAFRQTSVITGLEKLIHCVITALSEV